MSVVRPNVVLRCDYCNDALFHAQTADVDEARAQAGDNSIAGWDFFCGKDMCSYCVGQLRRQENA